MKDVSRNFCVTLIKFWVVIDEHKNVGEEMISLNWNFVEFLTIFVLNKNIVSKLKAFPEIMSFFRLLNF